MTVTLVTKDATLDDLSAQDYRDIYTELRQGKSLADVVLLLKSQYSRAMWGQYESGDRSLNRTMRNELRAAMNKDPLPLTIADATAQASPDAAVWKVGHEIAEHVILVGVTPVTLHVNGTVTVAKARAESTRQFVRNFRPRWSQAQDDRRVALGVNGQEVIEAGLSALEAAQCKD